MKLSTVGIPVLIGLAIFFYVVEIDGYQSIENDQKPALKSSQPLSDSPKRQPNVYKECMRLSHEQYKIDMSKFNWIRSQPEVDYGQLRDDKY